MRSRPGHTYLLKVKSHSGCLLNERADFYASQGHASDRLVSPGPATFSVIQLRVKDVVREKAAASLPRDGIPNNELVTRMVTVHVQQALQSHDTLFSKLLITSPPGTLPASTLRHSFPAAVRC